MNWKNPTNLKTICDLQKRLFIHKMFDDWKNDHVFQKVFVKARKMFINFKMVPPVSKKMFVNSRNVCLFKIFLNVHSS